MENNNMFSLIFDLEGLIIEAKGIAELMGTLAFTGDTGTSLDDFKNAVRILYGLSIDNSKKLENIWEKMSTEEKQLRTAGKSKKDGNAA